MVTPQVGGDLEEQHHLLCELAVHTVSVTRELSIETCYLGSQRCITDLPAHFPLPDLPRQAG